MMFFIGLICGLITGLISVGGGIFVIIALILFPPLIAQNSFTMQEITIFSIIQTFFSSLSGSLFYLKESLLDKNIALYFGIPSLFGGIIGVIIAHSISESILKTIFSILAVSAAITILIPSTPNDQKSLKFTWRVRVISMVGGFSVGVLGGVTGIGAGFLLVPLFISLYHLPLKKAIGTSLVTILLLSTGSFLAKINITEVPFVLVTALIIGSVIGAQTGGRLNRIFSPLLLKKIISFAIIIVSFRMLYDLF